MGEAEGVSTTHILDRTRLAVDLIELCFEGNTCALS